MNLFRSEEHIDRWINGRRPGETLTVTRLCDLAHSWWGDRLDSRWRPHTREHNQAILDSVGLTGPFWLLP